MELMIGTEATRLRRDKCCNTHACAWLVAAMVGVVGKKLLLPRDIGRVRNRRGHKSYEHLFVATSICCGLGCVYICGTEQFLGCANRTVGREVAVLVALFTVASPTQTQQVMEFTGKGWVLRFYRTRDILPD